MKKIILTLALVVSFAGVIQAQYADKAIGLRFGGGFGVGAEISYQQDLAKDHRLEVDLGMNNFGLNGVYQWVWALPQLGDGFDWYAGVGAGLGSYKINNEGASNFSLGVLGQVGIEYKFNIPLTLSLDYRPEVLVSPSFNGGYDGICLSARYRF